MFSGIIKGLFPVISVKTFPSLLQFTIEANSSFLEGIEPGASIAADGVCLTAARIDGCRVSFDVIEETLKKTTLKDLFIGRLVGCERSLKMGDEVGGHLVSGHVWGVAKIYDKKENVFTISCPADWIKYMFPKGFIALDGASLTIVDVDNKGLFTVHLIPETFKRTALGNKEMGDHVNLEIDSRTQTIVDALEEKGSIVYT